jgi:hypothetical protein
VMFDKKHDLLHMNLGAAAKAVFIKWTMLRFVIDGDRKDLEIIEIETGIIFLYEMGALIWIEVPDFILRVLIFRPYCWS